MSNDDTCRINGTYGSAIIRRFLLEGLLVQGFEGTEMTQEHLGWVSSKILSAMSGILLLLIENVRTWLFYSPQNFDKFIHLQRAGVSCISITFPKGI